MSKAKEFIKEINTTEKGLTDIIVTLKVKMRVQDTGDASPEEIGKIAQKALLDISDNIKSGDLSMYAISASVEGSKRVTFK
jgi:hypothetical protein